MHNIRRPVTPMFQTPQLNFTLADVFQSNCASVSGRGWLRVSGRDRVKRPATKPKTPISDIGTPAPRLDCMGEGGAEV